MKVVPSGAFGSLKSGSKLVITKFDNLQGQLPSILKQQRYRIRSQNICNGGYISRYFDCD